MKMEMQVVAPFSGKSPAGDDHPQRAGGHGSAAAADRTCRPATTRRRNGAGGVWRIAAPHGRQDESPSLPAAEPGGTPPAHAGLRCGPASTPRGCSPNGDSSCRSADRSDEIRRAEDEILNIFVDICSLFQREPEVEPPDRRRSAQRRSLSVLLLAHARYRGEGLPPAFVGCAAPGAGPLWRAHIWTARPNWKRACSGSTNRTNAWSSRSRPSWLCWNAVCERLEPLAPHADESLRSAARPDDLP